MFDRLLRPAAELFAKGDIQAAYALYQQAAARYGYKVVAYDLRRCEARLAGFQHPTERSLDKPRVSILLTSRKNLERFALPVTQTQLPYNLRFYITSADGIRPLHDAALFDVQGVDPGSVPGQVRLPQCELALTLAPDACFTQEELFACIHHSLRGEMPDERTPFTRFAFTPLPVVKDQVSVIIPTYKRPEHLGRAVQSVVQQDYPSKEIIVVSDNGHDGDWAKQTREVVWALQRQYPEVTIRFIEHKTPRNGAAARNTGLMQATGEFISFLDDDDIYLPRRLSACIAKLQHTPPEVGAVYCGYLGWNSSGNDHTRYLAGDLTFEILSLAYERHYLHTDTITYKREAVLALNGFDETYWRHQDLEFNLRFFDAYLIDTVNQALVQLHPKPSGVSNHVSGQELIRLKKKFLKKFKSIMSRFSSQQVCNIFFAHLDEIDDKFEKGV